MLRELLSLEIPWSDHSEDNQARFVKVTDQGTAGQTQPLAVTHCIDVNDDFTWKLYIHGQEVSKERCSVITGIAHTVTNEADIRQLFVLISNSNVRAGHPDDHFVDMVNAKKGKIQSKGGENLAYLDSSASVSLNGTVYTRTVRSSSCELLSHSPKCPTCVEYRSPLRAMYNRWNKRKLRSPSKCSCTSSRTPFIHLKTPERRKRYSQLRARTVAADKKLTRLRQRLEESIDQSGVTIESELHSELVKTMNEKNEEIQSQYKQGTFQQLFWDQQLQAAKAEYPTQVRWHPMMI